MARTKGKPGARRTPRRRRNSQMYMLAAGAGVIIAAVVVVIIVLSTRGGDNGGTVDLGAYNASGKTMGNTATAKVHVIEFADFQCPYCRQAAVSILPQLEKDYVNAGKVTLEYKHFLVVDRNSGDQESHLAAYAVECANDQDKFWDFYQIVFNNQKGENEGNFKTPKLEALASGLPGIDQARFNTCLESQQFKAVVDGDQKEGTARGVTGTPTFFVNDTKVAATYSDLKSAIDKALAQAQ